MKTMEIGFGKRNPETEKVEPLGTASMNLSETVEEAIEAYGADVVLSMANQQIKIAAQAVCRRAALADASTEQTVQTALDNYKPGVVTRSAGGGITKATLLKKMKGLGKDELVAVFAELGISMEDEPEGDANQDSE